MVAEILHSLPVMSGGGIFCSQLFRDVKCSVCLQKWNFFQCPRMYFQSELSTLEQVVLWGVKVTHWVL